MSLLSLDTINLSSPYEVYWHEKSHTYRYKTDYDATKSFHGVKIVDSMNNTSEPDEEAEDDT